MLKRRGRARGRSPLPSTSTRFYRLNMSKTFEILIYVQFQVLKQVHPVTGISSKAMPSINSFVNDVFERIASEAAKQA